MTSTDDPKGPCRPSPSPIRSPSSSGTVSPRASCASSAARTAGTTCTTRRCCAATASPTTSRVSGSRAAATLYTWTIAVQPFHPFYVDRIPYIVATVELDEEPGLMFMTQLTDCTEDDLRIGMPVEVTFVELHPELTLPFFRPRRPSTRRRVPDGHRRTPRRHRRLRVLARRAQHRPVDRRPHDPGHQGRARRRRPGRRRHRRHHVGGHRTAPRRVAARHRAGQLVGVGDDGAGVLVLGDPGHRRRRVGLLRHRARAARDRPAAERVGAGEGCGREPPDDVDAAPRRR